MSYDPGIRIKQESNRFVRFKTHIPIEIQPIFLLHRTFSPDFCQQKADCFRTRSLSLS